MPNERSILLTGATGYIGGRLLSSLEASDRKISCMARNPEHLRSRASSATELVRGDVLDPESLATALEGIDTAYYLIHSMGSGEDFERQDREGAKNFGAAARAAGVRRIIYLGGLGERTGEELSSHLRSRHETGALLRDSGVPVIELRTSIVLGSGSLSFELIRTLVERLPIMICPRWVRVETQPIAIEDVVSYLVASLDLDSCDSRVFEVGGAERVSYAGIMLEYARQRGLRRLLIPVPLLTLYLSSLWLGLTTPLYARVGRKLIESVRNPTVVRDNAALDVFPEIRPMGLTRAIERARRNEDREIAATRWSDALSSSGSQTSWGGVRFGTRLVDSRRLRVEASPERAFAPIRRIGGATGWYWASWLWRFRGFLDLLVGGVGMRRGRRDPEHLAVGDALDFWRVEDFEPDRCLRLRAEMKVPGRAWLEFEVEPDGSGSTIRQTAIFDPAGLGGLVYWYGIYPVHVQVFKGMLRGIGRKVDV